MEILNRLGDIQNVEPLGMRKLRTLGVNLLVATYFRPEKSAGGIITNVSTAKEDPFQSKVGLVVRIGSRSFKDDERSKWDGEEARLHDWVIFNPNNGLAMSVRGVHCRILQDVEIEGVLDNPDDLW